MMKTIALALDEKEEIDILRGGVVSSEVVFASKQVGRDDPVAPQSVPVAPEYTSTFFYDGWDLIEERIACTNGTSTTIHYHWGKDLSGTIGGAAGVSGLIYLTVSNSSTPNSSTQQLYIPYRFYHPGLMRWLNRDPIEEAGCVNLYAMCGNISVCIVDSLGLHIYVALYYSRNDQPEFRRAAETYMDDIERNKSFNAKCDKVILKGVLTADDFIVAWNELGDSSHEAKEFGQKRGQIVCHGCNTGLEDDQGNSLIKSFSTSQNVISYGQSGFSQFSENKYERTFFTRVDESSKTVYLWSYGDGGPKWTFGTARNPVSKSPTIGL